MAFARDLIKFSRLVSLNDFTKLSNSNSLNNFPFVTSVRTTKHYNPKFKWLRGKKFIKVDLPTPERTEELNKYLLNTLKVYPRYWKKRMMTVTSVGDILDPYEPPDGDGKVSKVSKLGSLENLKTGSKSFLAEKAALRKIKNYDPNFKMPIFLQEAQDIYVKVHTMLMDVKENNFQELAKYVTETAIDEMTTDLRYKTLRWKFIESLEPPKHVQSRVQEVLIESNLFAQLTVRFHSKQTLAIYDRFGRLMYGSEILAKDVLEYVVFEKHISNEYGAWRIAGKIIPESKKSATSFPRTYRIEPEEEEEEDEFGDTSPEPVPEHKSTSEIVKPES